LTTQALFIAYWDATDLSFMFIGSAIITLFTGIAYSLFVDRLSHTRLLYIIFSVNILWLVSVRILLTTNSGPYGLAYPYFYLGFDVVRDFVTIHLLTYANGFYNTRAAKRTLPVILSATLAANTVAGFSVSIFTVTIGQVNVPWVWILCLIIGMGLVYYMQRDGQMAERESSETPANTDDEAEKPSSMFDELREGFAFVANSGLLRWLAVGTFLLIILIYILTFRSLQLFETYFADDPDGLLLFYGLFDGISNLMAIIIQFVLVGWLVNRFGVGLSNLAYPTLTVLGLGLLNFFPNFWTANYGRFIHLGLRRALQKPLDAMLYNSFPPEIKGRARAFIDSMIVPVGVLFAGCLILAVRQQLISPFLLTISSLLIAAIYLWAMWRTKDEYGNELAKLLVDDEMSLLQKGQTDYIVPDPTTIRFLRDRLYSQELESEEMRVFLAEMLYELEGLDAVPILLDVAVLSMISDEDASDEDASDNLRWVTTDTADTQSDSPHIPKTSGEGAGVCAAIINMLSEDDISTPLFISFCLEQLQHPDSSVREAAAQALSKMPNVHRRPPILSEFVSLLDDPMLPVQAMVIPTLLSATLPVDVEDRTITYQSTAQAKLDGWLAPDSDITYRMMGLRVLASAGDNQLFELLEPYIHDPQPLVRLQAVTLIKRLVTHSTRASDKQEIHTQGHKVLQSFLQDRDETIRTEAIDGIASLPLEKSFDTLIPIFNDKQFLVRQHTCVLLSAALMTMNDALEQTSFSRKSQETLSELLKSENPLAVECSAYVLGRIGRKYQTRSYLEETIRRLTHDTYTLYQHRVTFSDSNIAEIHEQGIGLLLATYDEEIQLLLNRIFFLVEALSDAEQAKNIRSHLQGEDPNMRANAIEALETITTPQLAQHIAPLFEKPKISLRSIRQYQKNEPLLTFSIIQILHLIWPEWGEAKKNIHGERLAGNLLDKLIDAEKYSAISYEVKQYYHNTYLQTLIIYLLTEIYQTRHPDSQTSIQSDNQTAAPSVNLIEKPVRTPRKRTAKTPAKGLSVLMDDEKPVTETETVGETSSDVDTALDDMLSVKGTVRSPRKRAARTPSKNLSALMDGEKSIVETASVEEARSDADTALDDMLSGENSTRSPRKRMARTPPKNLSVLMDDDEESVTEKTSDAETNPDSDEALDDALSGLANTSRGSRQRSSSRGERTRRVRPSTEISEPAPTAEQNDTGADSLAAIAKHSARATQPKRPARPARNVAAMDLFVEKPSNPNPLYRDLDLSHDSLDAALMYTHEKLVGQDVPVLQETIQFSREILRENQKASDISLTRELTTIEEIIFLRQVPFFRDMSVSQLQMVAEISETVYYDENQPVFAEGDPGGLLYVVVKGRVALQTREVTERGSEQIKRLNVYNPFDYFGELSLFDDQERNSDAVAVVATQLLQVRRDSLVAMIQYRPQLAQSLLQVLSQRLREINRRIIEEKESSQTAKPLVDVLTRL
ncbi:MAG: cyclic nucleotide-binding domain-containing protein, partial [Chloroflexota bacterium]